MGVLRKVLHSIGDQAHHLTEQASAVAHHAYEGVTGLFFASGPGSKTAADANNDIIASATSNGSDVAANNVNDIHDATNGIAQGLDPTKLEFREFYAAACPHCVNLKPIWDQALGSYGGNIKWRQIECADQHWSPVPENQDLCQGIRGFPTMKMYDTSTGTDAAATEIGQFQGARDPESLLKFVNGFEHMGEENSMEEAHG